MSEDVVYANKFFVMSVRIAELEAVLRQLHHPFQHDYERDEKKCEICKILSRAAGSVFKESITEGVAALEAALDPVEFANRNESPPGWYDPIVEQIKNAISRLKKYTT